MNRRGTLFWVGLAVVVLAVGYLAGNRGSAGVALDPDGTDDVGTRGLVLLLEEYGVEVRRADAPPRPGDGTDVVLLLSDRLDGANRDLLTAWVEGGGTVVVADPSSPLSPPGLGRLIDGGPLPAGACGIDGLDDLVLEAEAYQLLSTDEVDRACFVRGDAAAVTETDRGRGRILALGTALLATNRNLDQGDAAALLLRLLVPERADGAGSGGSEGAGTVSILFDPVVEVGSRSLLDEVPVSVRWAGVQLAVAALLFVWNRARRFGRPVLEPQAVELPGSLLVRATGELLRRAGAHHRAGEVLRRHTTRRVRLHLSAPADITAEALVGELTGRTDVGVEAARRVLTGPLPEDRAALSALVADIDRIGAALTAATTPTVQDDDGSATDGTDPSGGPTGDPSTRHPGRELQLR